MTAVAQREQPAPPARRMSLDLVRKGKLDKPIHPKPANLYPRSSLPSARAIR